MSVVGSELSVDPLVWLDDLIAKKRRELIRIQEVAKASNVLNFGVHPNAAGEPNRNLDLVSSAVVLKGIRCRRSRNKEEVAYDVPAGADVTIFYQPSSWEQYADSTIAVISSPSRQWQINIRGNGTLERLNFKDARTKVEIRQPILRAVKISS